MRRASAISIAVSGVGRPGQLDQPVEIGADHRVLAGALGHALEPLQLLARLLLDFLGHLRRGDRAVELGDLRRAFVALAELLLDRAHLLAQQVLALAVVDRALRALGDVARDLQHLDPVREQIEQLVEPRLEVERLQQRLLFLGADVHQAGDEVREPRRALDALQRRHHLFGHLRQELEDLRRALLQAERAPLDVRVGRVGFVEELHPRRHERIAFQELQHAEALHALADGVMRAVRRRDVAQHVGHGADPVHVAGAGLFHFGLALQQYAERALQTRGLVRRGARAFASYREREHHARKQHDIAHRNDDQRIFGQRARRCSRLGPRLGRGGFDARAARRRAPDCRS